MFNSVHPAFIENMFLNGDCFASYICVFNRNVSQAKKINVTLVAKHVKQHISTPSGHISANMGSIDHHRVLRYAASIGYGFDH